jgi:hypothetical protein
VPVWAIAEQIETLIVEALPALLLRVHVIVGELVALEVEAEHLARNLHVVRAGGVERVRVPTALIFQAE